ncbi:ExeM/NucH family extracellular endonuclease [Demequina sp. SO4-13]|uniref:ExeM/NucH family extracellular endonuclease n=1 Tax=Demequina sp. SO4-13 TaxID=3401027 RepID=UPI003AF914A1
MTSPTSLTRRFGAASALGALGASLLVAVPAAAAEPASDLILSEYVEGSSFNKAVEIYNPTGATVDLSGYSLELYSNGNIPAQTTLDLAGALPAGETHVIVNTQSEAALLALADEENNVANFNGDDSLVLNNGDVVIDSFGQLEVDPGSEWTGGGQNDTLRRSATVCAGDTDPSDAFDASVEWETFDQDTFDGLGTHTVNCDGGPAPDVAPTVAEVDPADGAVGVPTEVAPVVTFSEPVSVEDGTFSLQCDNAGLTIAVTGDADTYTVTPDQSLTEAAECELTVDASTVADLDGETQNPMQEDYASTFTVSEGVVTIGTVQGETDESPYNGQTVTVEGVVVGDYEGTGAILGGFYLQSRDEDADDNPATSEGIYVYYEEETDLVSLGDVVSVTGEVDEFQGQTQIAFPDVVEVLEGETATATPASVTLPFADDDEAERYEGMAVEFDQELFLTEFYQLGRFGEVTVSSGGRQDQPTAVVEPGNEANALQAANDLGRIKLDDAFNNQNPETIIYGGGGEPLTADNPLRGGDSVTGLTGVMTYTWAGNSASGNAWRVRPASAESDAPVFESKNPRPTAAPEVGGSLKVASFNVLNYFTTIDGDGPICGPVGNEQYCRGADSQLELDRQTEKLVDAMVKLDADVIGIMEMENTAGVEPLAYLAEQINAEVGEGTYSYVDSGVIGSDVIRVGILYDTTAVTEAGSIAVLDSDVDERFDDSNNRPALAQAFEETATGETFTVVANHWKSKGSCASSGPNSDLGDGAACWNETRTLAAEAMVDWLETSPTGVEDDDVFILGDLNSYAQEDPIDVLREAGYVDQGEDGYGYVFDGQWGALDYVFASQSLAVQVTGAAHVNINADEVPVLDYNTDFKSEAQIQDLYAPNWYRTSDHDPLLVGLALGDTTPTFSDVDESLEHYEDILWMAEQGISTGWDDGTFRPFDHATRDAIAAFLFRWQDAAPVQAGDDVPSDVDESLEHYEDIIWLLESGYAEGWEDGTFRPFDSVTRDAMAAFLYRIAGEPEFTAPQEPTFSDVTADSSEHYLAIEWAADAGIVEGWDDGTFRPFEPVTRDAIAAFLSRASAR